MCVSEAGLLMVPFGKLMNSKETKEMQSELGNTISSDFAAYYQSIAEKVHEWVEPLSTTEIWRRPYRYGNSIGHLLLHLIGNRKSTRLNSSHRCISYAVFCLKTTNI